MPLHLLTCGARVRRRGGLLVGRAIVRAADQCGRVGHIAQIGQIAWVRVDAGVGVRVPFISLHLTSKIHS